METLGTRIRYLVGLALPIVGTSVMLFWPGPPEGWDAAAAGLFLAAIAFGPFILYLFVVRTPVLAISVGALLVAATVFTAFALDAAFDRGSSTAGLALLWLPFIGYPLVFAGWFLDVQARPWPQVDLLPPPERPSRPRRWSASVDGNTLEIARRRGPLE